MSQPGILSVNSGSSSIKFALYPVQNNALAPAFISGVLEGLEPDGQIRLRMNQQSLPADHISGENDDARFTAALQWLHQQVSLHAGSFTICAVAHRIVHGGGHYAASCAVTPDVLQTLRSYEHLAPLHQPHNLDGVAAFARAYPDVPQIACFDTGFHATMPDDETRFALPLREHEQGVRRYGFHGLSYRFVSHRLSELSVRASGRVLMAHLGNGASLCAMRNGESIATTMGFSALDGLMMGSRCGQLDPGVILHWLDQGRDRKSIEHLLYKESGLLGVSGISADMRTLRASDAPQAAAAISQFAYRIRREAGGLTAVLQGLDVLAFTGGIGEHDAQLRADVVQGLSYLGLKLDAAANRAANGDASIAIHAPDSSIEIWVVPTDEGMIAAQDALALIN